MSDKSESNTNCFLLRNAFLMLGFLFLPIGVMAQEAGDNILKQGQIAQDLYLAGGTIDMLADVDGDVIAAGGQINIDQSVTGDVMVAGGNVSIRARVGDDVRAAGGNITVSGPVGDEAIIAGGNVLISPTATIGGRALLGGANVRVDFPRLLRLWKNGRLDLEGMITRRMKLDEVNDAFRAMQAGEVIRSVLDFS